ncbi:hypothetical protein [Paenibacillus cellulositrophicus]|nr:hypothetical protein [Paenibacillus cellulositrophicus]
MSVRKRQFSPDRTDYGRCLPAGRGGALRFCHMPQPDRWGLGAKQRMRLT